MDDVRLANAAVFYAHMQAGFLNDPGTYTQEVMLQALEDAYKAGAQSRDLTIATLEATIKRLRRKILQLERTTAAIRESYNNVVQKGAQNHG